MDELAGAAGKDRISSGAGCCKSILVIWECWILRRRRRDGQAVAEGDGARDRGALWRFESYSAHVAEVSVEVEMFAYTAWCAPSIAGSM